MPFFFMISGYFYKNRSIKEEISVNFKKLIIPYLIVSFITILIKIKCLNKSIILSFLLGPSTNYSYWNLISVGPIWFLMCLFFSKLLFQIIQKGKNKFLNFIICVLLNICGFVISKHIFLPFNLDTVLITQIYFYAGYIIKQKDMLNTNNKYNIIMILLLIVLCHIGVFSQIFSLASRVYPNYPICIISNIVISYIFLLICKLLDKILLDNVKKIITFFGKNSLLIVCLHTLEFSIFNTEFINFKNEFVKEFCTFLFYLIIIIIAIGFLYLIKKLLNIINSNNKMEGF